MAKASSVNRDLKRRKLVKSQAAKRAALKAITQNRDLPLEERFAAMVKLSDLPSNGAKDPHPQSLRPDRSPAR